LLPTAILGLGPQRPHRPAEVGPIRREVTHRHVDLPVLAEAVTSPRLPRVLAPVCPVPPFHSFRAQRLAFRSSCARRSDDTDARTEARRCVGRSDRCALPVSAVLHRIHGLARAVIRICAGDHLLYHAAISARRFLRACNRM
jgi:hypothetical protein